MLLIVRCSLKVGVAYLLLTLLSIMLSWEMLSSEENVHSITNYTVKPKSHCVDIAPWLNHTLKSASVGDQSAYVGKWSG